LELRNFESIEDIQIKDLLRKEGVNGCLKKPIQLNELLTAITNRGRVEL